MGIFFFSCLTSCLFTFQLNSRMKILKRNLDEAEEEIQKEKTQKRKAQRECEDMLENQEALNREVNSLKTKLR